MEVEEDPVNQFMSLDRWPLSPSDCEEEGDESAEESFPPISQNSETYLLGFVIANIVGLQYYTGTVNGREVVGLVREPLNTYDSNAIKVLNMRTDQVGNIERSAAKVLAPLMDANLISVEGIVPNLPASQVRFKIPCQIHIFARTEAFSRVNLAITRGGLQLISHNDASFTLSEAVVVKERRDNIDLRSVDDIFKLVDEGLANKGYMIALEPPKNVIKSDLFMHQKQGLGWLIQRENSSELPPFWEEIDGLFMNVLTRYRTPLRPEPLRGGIFADDMGLGKTLTLLSLIAFDKYGSAFHPCKDVNTENGEDIAGEYEKLVLKKSKRGRMSRNCDNSKKKHKAVENHFEKLLKANQIGFSSCSSAFGSKTTLVVCPPSVFSSWIKQLADHTKAGKLKVYMYYGERTKDADELKKYDIILTTYSTLSNEDSWSDSPIKKIEWWRVILDEAHVIKNVHAQQSRAVTNLKAKRRWVVTGTPIQNGSFDLFSLMAFLRFEPFSIKSYWTSLVQRPLAHGDDKGLSRLQVLMATISLRRTKDKGLVGLPSKTIETCFVELSSEQRELYDQLEGEARSVVQNFIHDGSVLGNYSTVLSIILRLRQICTDLALCPSDLKSLLPSTNIEDVSNNPELLKKMVSMLQDGEDFDCPICISPPTDIVITCCAHIFCRSCILKTLKRTKPSCPLCRRSLKETDLFSAPPASSETVGTGVSSENVSSKVTTLIKLLSASRDINCNAKSVVFSQFRKMLLLLEEPLKKAGFRILRLDGSMNAKKRTQVIEEFGVPAPEGPTILLASLKAAGAGINLTAASTVYLLEPWWNPAVEEQAMDRVHRIGQTEDVKIVRMIARNSIEERILYLQEKKRKLAKEAFVRRSPRDRRDISMDDIRTLMFL